METCGRLARRKLVGFLCKTRLTLPVPTLSYRTQTTSTESFVSTVLNLHRPVVGSLPRKQSPVWLARTWSWWCHPSSCASVSEVVRPSTEVRSHELWVVVRFGDFVIVQSFGSVPRHFEYNPAHRGFSWVCDLQRTFAFLKKTSLRKLGSTGT